MKNIGECSPLGVHEYLSPKMYKFLELNFQDREAVLVNT